MKNKILTGFMMVSMLIMFACTDDSPKATIMDNVAANQLNALSKTDYTLLQDEAAATFETFTWTAPDFGFESSISYTLQLDTKGNNFATPVELVTTPGLLTTTMTVGAINKKLLDAGFTADEKADVEVRVRSMVNDNVTPVYSNIQSFSITPYSTVFPPIYVIGDAQGWDLGKAVKLKNIAVGTYESIGSFVKDGKFRFFASPAWDAQQWGYSFFDGGSIEGTLADGGDGDSNFLFTGESGTYKITVSTKDKTIVLTAVDEPALFMIGDAVQGWDLTKAVELTWLGGGLFETTTNFKNDIFRFYSAPDWGAGFGNYTYFADGKIDAAFEDKGDGDHNFNFVATPGSYKITVDVDDLTIVMTKQ